MTQPEEIDRLRISWAIPLPWLIGACVLVIGQGATVYYTQLRQGDILAQQSASIADLAAQVRVLSAQLSSKDGKDIEHDFRINDLDRRMQTIEQDDRRKRP